MKTEHLYIGSPQDTQGIRRAGQLLRQGAIVAFPTETVYGLGAKAEPDALERLDVVKGRAMGKRYSLHIGRQEDLNRYVPRLSLQAKKLMANVWPGPATLVFEYDKESLLSLQKTIPPQTFGLLYQDGTLGVRFPDNPVACAVLAEAVAPIVAPSANPGSQPPALTAQEVARYFDGQIEMIIDAPDACKYRLNSTVVKVSASGLQVLREGVYARAEIVKYATIRILFVCTGNTCRSPMAEAICRKYIADLCNCSLDRIGEFGYIIESAGVAAFDGMPASGHAMTIARQMGSPLDDHRSRPLTAERIEQADVIFAMSPSHLQGIIATVPSASDKCCLLDADGAIADPVGGDFEVYRDCARHIERAIKERMNEIL